MKRFVVISAFSAVALIALLAACEMSKADIERRVAEEFQERLDNDADTSRYGMKVSSVALIKSGGSSYKGYVTVTLDGSPHDIGITVTTDASDILLETDPFAFSFLTEKMLEQLFDW
jgi:hypothetical protein